MPGFAKLYTGMSASVGLMRNFGNYGGLSKRQAHPSHCVPGFAKLYTGMSASVGLMRNFGNYGGLSKR
ncbi:hypothetical protein K280104A7_16160 [Candidatus Bariatricus faecipullorum]